MSESEKPITLTGDELAALVISDDFGVTVSIAPVVVWLFVILGLALIAWRFLGSHRGIAGWKSFEIDEAKIGIGSQTITLRPNDTDRQIAYRIWVELSTRKIGLPIDPKNDVIAEVYESWYSFFGVTRELIKEVPVSKFRREGTEKIIRLSIEVLNAGIRPHLTRWQARFRRWYGQALESDEFRGMSPQDVQTKFPDYGALNRDLLAVNARLIAYRDQLYELITGR